MGKFFPSALWIAGLYLCNRLFLIPATSGGLHRFLAWYGNDLLAGALILLLLNTLLTLARRPVVRHWLPASLFLLGCGLFWECVTPLYLPRSVCDPWDLGAYWVGGILFLLLAGAKQENSCL